jgi:hypothetical protein
VEAGKCAGSVRRGTTGHAKDHAAVLVATRPTDPNSALPPKTLGSVEPTPDPAGQFMIIEVQGQTLTLTVSSSATVYEFNVNTLTFG